MRKVNLQGRPTPNSPSDWLERSLRDIAAASQENDTTDIAQNYTLTGALVATRTLNVSAPTVANVAAVLATLLDDMKKGGANRAN